MILVDRYESNEKRPPLDSVTNIIPCPKNSTDVGFLLTAQFDFEPLAFWGPERHPACLGLGSIVLSCHRLQVMHPDCTKNYWQQVLDAQWRNIWKLIWRPIAIFLLQSKSIGFISTLHAKSRVWHWHDATKPNLADYSPQVKQSWSRNLCFFKWWVWGMFWVGFWWDPRLGNCWVSISPTLRRLQKDPPRCKAKNPEMLALFSRLPWVTNQQNNAMKLCNHVTWSMEGKTWDIQTVLQAANCSFSPGPVLARIYVCVANVHLYGSNCCHSKPV